MVREGHDVTDQPTRAEGGADHRALSSPCSHRWTPRRGPRWPVASRSTTPASPTMSAASSRGGWSSARPGASTPSIWPGRGPGGSRPLGRAPFLEEPLDPVTSDVIELSVLHAFLRNPTAAFFGSRLEARLPRPEDDHAHRTGRRCLRAERMGRRLAAPRGPPGRTTPSRSGSRYERQLGTLPPSPLGDAQIRRFWTRPSRSCWTPPIRPAWRPGPPAPVPWPPCCPTAPGWSVRSHCDWRAGPTDASGPAALYYSRSKPTHRVAAWLDLMALVATDPGRQWRSLAVSRPEQPGGSPTINDLVPNAAVERAPAVGIRRAGRGRGLLPTGDDRAAAALPHVLVVPVPRQVAPEPMERLPVPRGRGHSWPCGWPSTTGTSTASPTWRPGPPIPGGQGPRHAVRHLSPPDDRPVHHVGRRAGGRDPSRTADR